VALADLSAQLSAAASKQPQPELHIRGDKAVRYEHVVLLMTAARQAGLKKIGFVTEPK
jgi:biopolymer transport protein ExbD